MADYKKEDQVLWLNHIIEKLNIRLARIHRSLEEGQEEIRNMQDYYWENYTEMDEYGYEEYDNQQALLGQARANQELQVLRHRFEKMVDAPYFGRVDFLFEGEDEPESFYIGIANFAEKAGKIPLIYDWRAPVSGLFYDYDKGPAFYDAPGGRMEGEIISKWQYKIKGGKLVYCFESDTKIDDDILKEELGSSSDVKLKSIVSTIQREQNAIIRNTADRILVIQGAAGSGKTSVALHRIAYLLYHERNRLKASDVLILSPNNVFTDYISHILPELGEENIQEMSFDLFAYRELRDTVYDCEDRYDYLEKMMKFPDFDMEHRFKEKQSKDFIGQIEGFLAGLEDELMNFRTIRFRKTEMTEQHIIHLFYFKFLDIPLLSRMDAVKEYFIDEYETLNGREISLEDEEWLQQQFDSMYETRDIYEIYNRLLKECGYPQLPDLTYDEKRKLDYEDVFPMLYLKNRLKGSRQHKHVKHLVIDEMQDYSYLQYELLKSLFSCRMTILGDRAQTLDTQMQDVLKFLPGIFGREIRKIVMNKSYRNTIEIASYANAIAGIRDLELLERHGKEVEEQSFETEGEMLTEILKKLRLGENGFETAAVITMTKIEATDIYRLLQNKGLQIHYIDQNSMAFQRGLTVTTFYMAKGLEFDQVFCVRGAKENPLAAQADYICATRALHELYMYDYKKFY